MKSGTPVYGLWITLESPSICEMAVALGLDWVTIDAEHGHLDWKEIAEHVRATVRSDTVALVRIAELSVGLPCMLHKTLAPARGALGADATDAALRIGCGGYRRLELQGGFDPRDDYAVGADIEGALDQRGRVFGETDKDHGVAAHRSADVFDDFLPIEVTVFGVDRHPVESQRDRHLADARRLQRNPEPVDGRAGLHFRTEALQGGDFHESK